MTAGAVSYYTNDMSSEKPLEFKLKAYEFKPDPRPLKISWTRVSELDPSCPVNRLSDALREMIDEVVAEIREAIWQQKIDSILKTAADKEAAYRRKIALFVEQTEKEDDN